MGLTLSSDIILKYRHRKKNDLKDTLFGKKRFGGFWYKEFPPILYLVEFLFVLNCFLSITLFP